MNPHRETEKPCAECEAREADLKKMLDFEPTKDRDRRTCPSCLTKAARFWFMGPCTSNNLIHKRGFWFLRWWGRDVRRCPVKTRHFHMTCDVCGDTWMMKTAAETAAAP